MAAAAIVASVLGFLILLRVLFARAQRAERAPSSVLSEPGVGADAGRIWATMQRLAQPTLLLSPAETPGFCKIGGNPDLPVGGAWPVGPQGPLGFLLQLDLAEIRASGGPEWLPANGALYAFHDERWGTGDQVRVVFAADGRREPASPPEQLPKAWRYPQRYVRLRRLTSLPSLDWLAEDVRKIDVSDRELDALADAPDQPFGRGPQTRIGGYPSEIQDAQLAIEADYASRGLRRDAGAPVPPDIAKAATDWRLLMQIDSDRSLKMMWGDAGRFYVFIREADARTADFSRTVTINQTH